MAHSGASLALGARVLFEMSKQFSKAFMYTTPPSCTATSKLECEAFEVGAGLDLKTAEMLLSEMA
jgi:hypothetical protein